MARVQVASQAWGYCVDKDTGRPRPGALHIIDTTVYEAATGAAEIDPSDYVTDDEGLLPGFVDAGVYNQTDPDGDTIQVEAYSGADSARLNLVESGGRTAVTQEAPLNVDWPEYASLVVADDWTDALQAAVDAMPVAGGEIFVPNRATLRPVSDTVVVPDVRGFCLRGESINASGFQMTANNKSIIETSGEFQRGLEFSELRLTYATQQTPGSHPNSSCIALNGPAGTNVYMSLFRRLYFEKCVKWIGIGATSGEFLVWNNTFEELQGASTTRSLIDIVPPAGSGYFPVNHFRRISYVEETNVTPDGPALKLRGEVRLEAIDIEDWVGQLIDLKTGNCTLDGLHIERWTAVDSVPGIRCEEGVFDFKGIEVVDVAVGSGDEAWLIEGVSPARIRAGGASIAKTGSGDFYHHKAAAGASVIADQPRVYLGTAPLMFPDAGTRAMTRVPDGTGGLGMQTIASAATLPLPETGKCFYVSGTTTISDIPVSWCEREITLIPISAGLTINVGGTSFTSANGFRDTISYVSDGGGWYETHRNPA